LKEERTGPTEIVHRSLSTPELYEAVQALGRSIPYAVNEEGYLAVLDPREA